MLPKTGLAIVPLLLIAAVGCDDDASTTPTGTAVVIYQDTDFRGDSRALADSVPDLDDLPGCGGAGADWDDCISSIRIPPGWSVTIFDEDDFTGRSATLAANVPDLGRIDGPCGDDWDDCMASILVRRP